MARPIVRAEWFEKKTITEMESLGVYRPEYGQIIKIYSKLLEQYEKLRSKIEIEDMLERTDGVITLENLRRDIAKYSDMLCLNPRIFEKTSIKEKPKLSKLDAALEKIANG